MNLNEIFINFQKKVLIFLDFNEKKKKKNLKHDLNLII